MGNPPFIKSKQKHAIQKDGPSGEGRLETSKVMGNDGKWSVLNMLHKKSVELLWLGVNTDTL